MPKLIKSIQHMGNWSSEEAPQLESDPSQLESTAHTAAALCNNMTSQNDSSNTATETAHTVQTATVTPSTHAPATDTRTDITAQADITTAIDPTDHPLQCLKSDVLVVTKDGFETSLNRRELALLSGYFRVLFSWHHIGNCRLSEVSCGELNVCVQEARKASSGERTTLSVTQAVNLIEPASYLLMDGLLQRLGQITLRRTPTRNLLQVYRYVLRIWPLFAAAIWERIIQEFDRLVQDKGHRQMTREEMTEALADRALPLTCKQEIQVIRDWNMIHCQKIKQYAELEALKLENDCGLTEKDDRIVRKRIPSSAVVTIGGWSTNGPTALLETFNTRSLQWTQSRIQGIDTGTMRAYQITAMIGDGLLVGGGLAADGVSIFHDCSIFDFHSKTWQRTCNLHDKRCYAASIGFADSRGKQFVFAAGGFNGRQRVRSCELFEVSQRQWHRMANMGKRRSDAAAILLDNGVMIAGGLDEHTKHNTAEMFDFETEKWYPISSAMHNNRTGVSGVSIGRSTAIVAGGFDGYKRLNTVERYDEREGKWHSDIAKMEHRRSNFGIMALDNHIYVAGGYIQPSICHHTERYDIRANRWEKLQPLSEKKSALRLVLVENHPALAELLDFHDDFDYSNKDRTVAAYLQ
ncbi:hypothetical protein WR25_14160 [Diploscapter pachys]|uniref:BTB domain-containing protein n=1 Tax=Diploscapter pachys TaxID=2018661 RepID=A0A2A2KLT6_9BILA|nr:hypothetical protein WR25_14160 [Diploscapter pachys]